MNPALWTLMNRVRDLIQNEEGQDLAEFVMVTGLVALAIVASLRTVAAPLCTLISGATTALLNA